MLTLLEKPLSSLTEIKALLGEETTKMLLSATLAEAAQAIDAISATNLSLMERAEVIHKSVGSCAAMGLSDLAETLSEAEACCRASNDPATGNLSLIARMLLKESELEHGVSA